MHNRTLSYHLSPITLETKQLIIYFVDNYMWNAGYKSANRYSLYERKFGHS